MADEAFLALYDARAESLLAFFVRRVLSAEVAADLVAETFAEAYASRAGFDSSRGEPGGWLFGIAKRKLARYRQTRFVEQTARVRIGMPDRSWTSEELDAIEQLIDFAALGRRVRAELDNLPPRQRDAVVLRVVDELGYVEIGERLGCSPANARTRVSRGLLALSKLVSGSTSEEASA
jgi:RNA polymerase sigma-70 factor (ECF subfamily)